MKNNRLAGIYRFIVFFLLIAIVVTSSFLLFMHYIEFDKEHIRNAAIITLGNVIFITIVFFTLDTIRNMIFTEKPVKRIIKGLNYITNGDYDTRIKPVSVFSGMADYNEIIVNINKMAQELSGVETLRNDFVSNVSHEMKTPLSVIRNYAQLLEKSELTESERMEYAKAIDAACKRLSTLVENILKLNKLENQQIFPKVKRYNLSEQMCEVLLEFENIWESKKIEIETEIEEDVFIKEDPSLMSLVWHNLISNALKFTDEGGKVTAKVYTQDDCVIISVSDTGCGMDSNTGKHIFEKFYQGDTSHVSKGNGLGLALVKRIIDIINAEIYVESELGKGSTFAVRLQKGAE